jgi:hypothetical protein
MPVEMHGPLVSLFFELMTTNPLYVSLLLYMFFIIDCALLSAMMKWFNPCRARMIFHREDAFPGVSDREGNEWRQQ